MANSKWNSCVVLPQVPPTEFFSRLYRASVWLFMITVVTSVLADFASIYLAKGAVGAASLKHIALDSIFFFILTFPAYLIFFYRPLVRQVSVTNRLQMELQESEERFHSFFEFSVDGMICSHVNGNIMAVNPAACRSLGMTDQEIIQRGLDGIVDTTDAQSMAVGTEAFRKGAFRGELTFRHKDGTAIPVELTSALFIDRHGEETASITFRDITERKQTDEELLFSRQRLRDLASHLQQAREDERIRIARSIHDELGQVLATVKTGISLLVAKYSDHRYLTEKISAMEELLESSIKTVRRISSELRPPMLDVLGLGEVVRWQAEEFQKNTGVECSPAILLQRSPISRASSTAIYRILQESLTNIIRHSGANYVDITLKEQNDRVILVVRDNGRGITREQCDGGHSFGILGMRERVTTCGGKIKICGSPGNGTVIIVKIPISSTESPL